MNTAHDVYFSIVIPVRNEAENVGQCLKSVLASDTHARHEIIFVDNNSTDNTVSLIKAMGAAVLEKKPTVTISALRNAGARLTHGPILVFLDADMQVPPDLLENARKWFDSGFTGALGFTENVPPDAGWVGRTWGTRLSQKLDQVVDAGYLTGRNLFINRSVFETIGGFDETLETNEDKDLSHRVVKAGYRIISIPETHLFHLGYEKNLAEFIRKEYWRQGSSLAVIQRRGFSLRALRAPLLSFWHLAAPAAALVAFAAGWGNFTLVLLAAWIAPAAVIACFKLGLGSSWPFFSSFLFLTFLRWNAAGAALAKQLFRLFFPRCPTNAAGTTPSKTA